MNLRKSIVATAALLTVSYTLAGTQWYLSNVTVNYSSADALSGLADAGDAAFAVATSTEGASVATAGKTVYDVAGNPSSITPKHFAVDKTAPDFNSGLRSLNSWATSAPPAISPSPRNCTKFCRQFSRAWRSAKPGNQPSKR